MSEKINPNHIEAALLWADTYRSVRTAADASFNPVKILAAALREAEEGIRVLNTEIDRLRDEAHAAAELRAKLAAYEQWADEAEVREAEKIAKGRMHEDGGIAECPHWHDGCDCQGWAATILYRALRAERAKVAEITRERDRWMNLECSDAVACPHIVVLKSAESRLKAQGEALAAAEKAMGDAVPKVHEYLPSVANDLINALAKLRAAKEGA